MQKGIIKEISEGGKRAKILTFQNKVLDNVLLLHAYGESSNPPIDSLVLLFFSLGSEANSFAIPYNPSLQSALESGEKEIGNFSVGNKITFKANGDVEITGTADFLATSLNNLNINASTQIILNAPDVSLGDAAALVLNELATMQVVVTMGSSAGTYPVDILTAGQTKVKA